MSYIDTGSSPGIFITREPDMRGNYVCNGTNDQVEFNAAIDRIDTLTGYGGFIWIGPGSYTIQDSIDASNLAIRFYGLGGICQGGASVEFPVVELSAGNSLTDFIIKWDNTNTVMHGAVDHIVLNGETKTGPLGGILLDNCQMFNINHTYCNDFYNTSGPGAGIKLRGTTSTDTRFNMMKHTSVRRCTRGIWFDTYANNNIVIGGAGHGQAGGASTKYGIWGNGAGGATTHNKFFNYDIDKHFGSNQIAFYLDYQATNWEMYGCRLETSYIGVQLDSGCNDNLWMSGTCSNMEPGGSYIVDNGNNNHFVWHKGISFTKRLQSGTFSVASTGRKTWSISHGMDYTPEPKDVTATLMENTSDNTYYTSAPRVLGTTSTTISGDIYVINAGAGGSTARVGVWVSKANW